MLQAYSVQISPDMWWGLPEFSLLRPLPTEMCADSIWNPKAIGFLLTNEGAIQKRAFHPSIPTVNEA